VYDAQLLRLTGPRARTEVLREDVELAAAVPADALGPATAASVARIVRVPSGPWDPRRSLDGARSGIGLLVLSGLLRRRAGWGDRRGAELLGPGDVLRPWEYVSGPRLADTDDWRALAPVRLAVLDAAWTRRMACWPGVHGALIGRALDRARRAVALMALAHVRRLDERVWLLLSELAERFGRVGPDGVRLELSLTHATLAELAGARRTSVSAALSRLVRAGRLRPAARGWVLVGPPAPAAGQPANRRGRGSDGRGKRRPQCDPA
jgi:CRP/FNR family cyclic AMP-dependent transcriptional regulator